MKQGTSNIKPSTNTPKNEKTSSIKVMVQDNYSIYLQGFCYILRDWGFQVTGAAQDHLGLMEAFVSYGQPDIAIIQYKSQTSESFMLAKEILGSYPNIKLVFLVNPERDLYIPAVKMKYAGIAGIIDKKHHTLNQVKQGLITIYEGGTFLDLSQMIK